MNKMIRSVIFLCTSLLVPYFTMAQEEAIGNKYEILKAIANLKPLHIYGRVVDQDGQPVPSAKVRVSWTEVSIPPDPGQSKWIETNNSGDWQITIHKPGRASVRDIEKEDYQFDRKSSPYFTAPNREELIRQTTPKNPLILTIRKKTDTTFLIHNKGRIDFLPPSSVNKVDLFEKKNYAGEALADHNGDHPWDLKIGATFSEDAQEWDFVIVANAQDGGGVLATNNAFYEAPMEGYNKEHRNSVTLEYHRKEVILCVKSRTPAVYSRVNIQCVPGKERCILSYESWGNPYGSRNLEYDTDLKEEWRLRKQLEKESKSLLKRGKRPKKPDLKALIEAEKENKK